MRIDMVYSAAGIRFALGKVNKSEIPLNIDEGVKLILKQSNDTAKISYSESEKLFSDSPKTAFLNWNSRFSPDGVFKLFNNR